MHDQLRILNHLIEMTIIQIVFKYSIRRNKNDWMNFVCHMQIPLRIIWSITVNHNIIERIKTLWYNIHMTSYEQNICISHYFSGFDILKIKFANIMTLYKKKVSSSIDFYLIRYSNYQFYRISYGLPQIIATEVIW